MKKYGDLVLKEDLCSVTKFFHSTFLFTNDSGTWIVQNDKIFLANLTKSFKRYHQLGASHCQLTRNTQQQFGQTHIISTVIWGLFNNNGEQLVDFEVSYGIKLFDEEYKFIFVIDHNEDENIQQYEKLK